MKGGGSTFNYGLWFVLRWIDEFPSLDTLHMDAPQLPVCYADNFCHVPLFDRLVW